MAANEKKNKTKTEKEYEFLKELIEKYGLDPDVDVHTQKNKAGKFQYAIINRRGIEKIEAIEGIVCEYEYVVAQKDFILMDYYANFAEGDERKFPAPVKTTAEASDKNATSGYLAALCEKRGKSRAILKLLGLYKYGVFGEDESEEFKNKGNYTESDI